MFLPMALMCSMSMIGILVVARPAGSGARGWKIQGAGGAQAGDFRMDGRATGG